MDLHYCKLIATEEEKKLYKTWKFEEWHLSNEYGWVKLPNNEFSLPSVNEDKVRRVEYFKTSNEEDLIFLEKEQKAFNEFYLKTIDEIKTAQRANNKLKF